MFQFFIVLNSQDKKTECLSRRDCYRILNNPEQYSAELIRLAKAVVENAFTQTRTEPPFTYTETLFDRWLQQQYDIAHQRSRQRHYLDSGILPDGRQLPPFSDVAVAELLFQKTPQNINDGTFLAKVGAVGPCNSVEAALMKIKFEEAGSGDVREHHPNLYYDLITKELGIKLPLLINLSEDRRLIDSAFDDPVFQLAIAQFPQRYFPEILGMTLLLEWTGSLDAFRMAKVLRGRKINPKFYNVHVLADNPKNGHASQAKETVKLYLREIQSGQGEAAKQELWRRIYQGWHTWNWIMDNFERDLVNHLVDFEANRAA